MHNLSNTRVGLRDDDDRYDGGVIRLGGLGQPPNARSRGPFIYDVCLIWGVFGGPLSPRLKFKQLSLIGSWGRGCPLGTAHHQAAVDIPSEDPNMSMGLPKSESQP